MVEPETHIAVAARRRIGVGLWTMQSTATAPGHPTGLYRDLVEAAVAADGLGLHSLWSAQHRIWYDGWCPAPLHGLALAVARTRRLRFATSVLTLPQQDPLALARTAAALDRLSGGRLDLGVGLGHRDAEYDAMGVPRRRRGRLMDDALAILDATWSGRTGDPSPATRPGPPVWIGGMSEAALNRAARTGHGLILPQSLTADELAACVADFRARGGTGRVAVMRDVRVTGDARAAGRFRTALRRHYREEIGAWWVLKGRIGFAMPEQVERQLHRIDGCALVGDAGAVAAGLAELYAAGADLVSVRVMFDFVDLATARGQLEAVAGEVAGAIDAAGALA
jgi:alkanesulfonate monooxygenase SsuD/methylene tetrahydromethanopterin reductase-like flavin-dependent oxidoreductase (luciferase family)